MWKQVFQQKASMDGGKPFVEEYREALHYSSDSDITAAEEGEETDGEDEATPPCTSRKVLDCLGKVTDYVLLLSPCKSASHGRSIGMYCGMENDFREASSFCANNSFRLYKRNLTLLV